jgi:ArsR family transcriptional regulator
MAKDQLLSKFSALANSYRLEIVRNILQAREQGREMNIQQSLGEIGINLPPSSISHHIKVLVEAEIIVRQKKGRDVILSIHPGAFSEIYRFIDI